jgi:hemolysin III
LSRDLLAREFLADGVIHALGLALAAVGTLALVILAVIAGSATVLVSLVIYASGLLGMLGCSAAYHLRRASRRRDWLRRLDHAAIFAMIAGSYTPFTTLGLDGAWSVALTVLVWSVAFVGIGLKLWQPRRIEGISVVLYLGLGWIGLVAIDPFLAALHGSTLGLLAAGGVLYSAGVVFHVWRTLPYHNAIWHGFVLAAAAVHYVAVLTVIPPLT